LSDRLASRPAVLISIATAFSLLGDQMLYSVLPTYFTEIGLMPYQVGLVLSANRFIRLITNHLAEHFCRRVRLNILIVLAFGIGAAVTFAYAQLTHFGLLILARVIWGLCWSFIRQIGLMTVVESSPDDRLGRSMGVYSGLSRTGSVAGNLIGAIGHDAIGFSATLVSFSIVSVLAIPLGLLSRRGLHHHLVEDTGDQRSGSQPWGLLFGGFVVGCVGSGLVMSTLGLVLKQTVGDDVALFGLTIGVASLNGLFLSIRWVSDFLGAPALGHFGDRLGRDRAATLFFGIGTATLVAAGFATTLTGIGLSVLLFFFCAVGLTTILMAEAGRLGSRTTARYVTAADFGSALGPALGWTSQQFASSTDIIFVMGALFYTAGLIATRMRTLPKPSSMP
jgi:MFS family permease